MPFKYSPQDAPRQRAQREAITAKRLADLKLRTFPKWTQSELAKVQEGKKIQIRFLGMMI
jgi:hypothetical protein